MHELPLVFFTVFTQSAVGAFILLLIGGAMGWSRRGARLLVCSR